ncbi:DUF602-domain-containing protein [Nadsonia fulvescens var. elongata DSM 6958]|uniref:DUF602-domain-containing protein n=1 Tax=Nadsonia fulvescens var. elongata DSM 6958 TaxID=857566 RepID=A0A1E3PS71_9ASCO|nr:DUF602-domain-containing protein [Nadsonia fulvescens var. elongata DSM 6958]
MGNDGGSIPTRRELVKDSTLGPTTAQIFEKNQMNAEYFWKTCLLSNKKLEEPLVSDYRGNIYNKTAIIEWLLEKKTRGLGKEGQTTSEKFPKGAMIVQHINSMKDVVEVKLSRDKEGNWICPLSYKEVDSMGVRFGYLVPCGHGFTDNAIRQLDDPEGRCPECSEKFSLDDFIVLNPLKTEDREQLENRMDSLTAKGLTHSLKPLKNAKNAKKTKKRLRAALDENDSEIVVADKPKLTSHPLQPESHEPSKKKRFETIVV